MEIAIANSNNEVSLWCDNIREYSNGRIHFSVINGAWDGWIKDDEVYVKATKQSFFGNKIVWRGRARGRDYNEAMEWIRDTIKEVPDGKETLPSS